MDIEQAETALIEARRARSEVGKARDAKIFDARITIELEFAARIKDADEKVNSAKHALDSARIAAVETHPLAGKIVTRTFKKRSSWGSSYSVVEETGTVEIVTSETTFAKNLPYYSKPKIGDLVVRLHKKDGKPGLKFERLTNQWSAVK